MLGDRSGRPPGRGGRARRPGPTGPRPRRRRPRWSAAATGSRRSATTSSAAGSRSTGPPASRPPEVDAAVRAHLDRTTLLSATLLDCALARRGAPGVRGVRRRARHPDEPDRAAALAAVGHTSGARAAVRRPARPHPRSRGAAHDQPRRAPARRVRRLGHPAPGQPRPCRASTACSPPRSRWRPPLNVEVLTEMGFDVPAEAGPNDLVVALRLDGPDALAGALAGVEQALARREPPRVRPVRARAAAHHRQRPPPYARRDRAGLGARARTRSSRRWTPSTPAAT